LRLTGVMSIVRRRDKCEGQRETQMPTLSETPTQDSDAKCQSESFWQKGICPSLRFWSVPS